MPSYVLHRVKKPLIPYGGLNCAGFMATVFPLLARLELYYCIIVLVVVILIECIAITSGLVY